MRGQLCSASPFLLCFHVPHHLPAWLTERCNAPPTFQPFASLSVVAILQSGDVGGLVAPLLLLLARRMGLDPLRVPFAVMGIAASAGALVIAQVRCS